MGVKCPSCGFESPESASWCDFCKESFNKKKSTPEASLSQAPSRVLIGNPAPEVPPLVDDEKIPILAPWLKWLSWFFFALSLAGILLLGRALMVYQRSKYEERNAPIPEPLEENNRNIDPR